MSNPYEGDVLRPPRPLNLKPYNFEIKDYDYMKNLIQCNTPIETPIIKSPDFHVQLDHTLAVIWLFYRNTNNWSKLTTSHLEWAIRFIDGVLSLADDGKYNDVELIKKHLEELLIENYAETDLNKISGETCRITAMPVIEQVKYSFDQKQMLETVTTLLVPHTKSNNNHDIIKELSDELAYIKFCRAKIRKSIKNACKVNRLVQDVKSLAADIKRLRENFLTIKDRSNLFL